MAGRYDLLLYGVLLLVAWSIAWQVAIKPWLRGRGERRGFDVKRKE